MSSTTQKPHAPSVTKATFDEDVLNSPIPVLVDFWAPWCPPCRAIGPLIDALAEEYAGKARVFKLDVDDEPDIEAKYGVKSIPTLIFFKNGEPVETVVGAFPKAKYAQKLDQLIG